MKQRNFLPEGYQFRPANMSDLEATVQMLNDWSRHALGVEKFTLSDNQMEWSTPGFNLERDTRLVLAPDNQVVGYYEVWDVDDPHTRIHCWGRIHPEHLGMGVGSCLLTWAEERARKSIPIAPPEARVVFLAHALSSDGAARELFQDHGFDLTRYSRRMVIELNGLPPEPAWPEGISVRPLASIDELADVIRTVRSAFKDHYGYVERPFDDELARWEHVTQNYEHYDPALWFLALDGKEIAGVSLCYSKTDDDPEMGWVGTLGVRRSWRRQGIGLALLYHSFRAFHHRGRKRVGLGVDASSLTGATRLYERAGMRSDPAWQFSLFEKELRPGIELSTQTL